MASQSPKLGLVIPTVADQFSTQDVANNWSTIDRYPGAYICTSASRPNSGVGSAPVWTTAHKGMSIRETDTSLAWNWTGTAFVRGSSAGRLGGATNTGTVSATSPTYVTIVTASNISVPAGSRWIQILFTWNLIQNTNGISVVGFVLDGSVGQTFSVSGDSAAASQGAQGSAGNLISTLQVAAGVHSFSVAIRTVALAPPAGMGTSTASNCAINIFET